MTIVHRSSFPAPLIRLVDDDAQVRSSEAFVLSLEGFETAGYASARAFLDEDDSSRPGCVVLDVRMPEMSGLELQLEMMRRGMTLPILFLTGHGDIGMAVMAIRRGAADFVEKPIAPKALQSRVRRLAAWHQTFCRSLAEQQAAAAELASLTPRELEVARLAAKGLLSREIADILGSSELTVKQQRAAALRKLDLRNAAELADFIAFAETPPDPRVPLDMKDPLGAAP